MARRQTTWKFTDVLSPEGRGYYHRTQRPLHCLVFLLPFLAAYEVGVIWRQTYDPGRPMPSLVAGKLIQQFIELLGASGFYFPALLLIAILFAWHLAARHSWAIDKPTLAGMLGESVIWAFPLFVFNKVLQQARVDSLQARWLDEMILSVGAGIYEELVFRLIAITLLSLILVDVCSLPRTAAIGLILPLSAALFAALHHRPFGDEEFVAVKFFFRMGAGLYLAGIFLFRGFGIAAGAHAVYDIMVVTLAALQTAGRGG